jgi:ATPase, P-type (transporting), HAD superfamily, subfamily IC/heavy metal translocating P-type ATPase
MYCAGESAQGREDVTSYRLVHESPGRLRFRPDGSAPRPGRDDLAAWLKKTVECRGETFVTLGEHTRSVLVEYSNAKDRDSVLAAFYACAPAGDTGKGSLARGAKLALREPEEETVANPIPGRIFSLLFLPARMRFSVSAMRSIPYILSGLGAVFSGRINLVALDGAALLVCLLRRDFRSLGSIIFFFALGEWISDWTRKKSRASLAESLSLNIDQVWVREGEIERQIPLDDVQVDDHVVVRAGHVFPVDGIVAEGEGMVNQASMTGESMPVHKRPGVNVFAGTVLEEGTLLIRATQVGGNTRITSIIRNIEDSEAVKASIQSRYEHMADAIVPYNFLLAGLIFALTGNAMRASSVLLVDYSCAIRLATPLCIFTAMREASEKGVLIKGGKFMEAIAEADAVVFDKTGTLTEAKPTLVGVIPFGEWDHDTVLRLAACLEEHFAHPVGLAVVNAAQKARLMHSEEHTEVEYVVAHGIASRWNGQQVLIGSYHFVREDRGIPFSRKQQALIQGEQKMGRSVLYLAIGKELAGILLIEDKLRAETATVIEQLRKDGIKRIVMLTGDGELTAKNIAEQAGITEYRAHLLPEQKAQILLDLKAGGHKVIMIGDGINDSLALSNADAGVAMMDSADIAREVADIVLVSGNLGGIPFARRISRRAIARVRFQFYTSVAVNSLFMIGGLLGLFTPAVSALLHNASTAAIAVGSVMPVDRESNPPGPVPRT